jgi:hypothetical protein
MQTNPRHSSATAQWGSVPEIVEIGREVLGGFSLDPFSNAAWNTVIGADRIITKRQNAYRVPWFEGAPTPGEIFDMLTSTTYLRVGQPPSYEETANVNPPGDRSGANVKRAWALTDFYVESGWLGGGALWNGFNLNQLQTCQGLARRSPLDADFTGFRCIPKKRKPYQKRPGVLGTQPSHPSWFMILPAIVQERREAQRKAFARLCRDLGEVF